MVLRGINESQEAVLMPHEMSVPKKRERKGYQTRKDIGEKEKQEQTFICN